MKKRYIFLGLGLLGTLSASMMYSKHPIFGRNPRGRYRKKLLNSKNYDGKIFKNIEETPSVFNLSTFKQTLRQYRDTAKDNIVPDVEIPLIKTNLLEKDLDNYYIWFGHSSYLIKLYGITYLIDPVFSGNVSPIPKTSPAFAGTDYYQLENIPEIDYLIITHDHYDHLDYETVKKLRFKINKAIVPLGVGSHLRKWGYKLNKIVELDWGESYKTDEVSEIMSTVARHSSGRTFKQNRTLWSSYVLKSKDKRFFLGGDSSYGKHYKEIGDEYGPFDAVFLENGQYNVLWEQNHMFPEETLKAARDLKANKLIPVHNSKFKLSLHMWNSPLIDLMQLNDDKYHLDILTPKIGELLNLDNLDIELERWFDK